MHAACEQSSRKLKKLFKTIFFVSKIKQYFSSNLQCGSRERKKQHNLLTAQKCNNCHLGGVYWEKSYTTQNVKKRNKKKHFDLDSRLTSRNDSLKACSVDKGTFYCLSLNVRPVYPFLKSVVIHHSYIIDVRNSQSSHHVHVRIIDIHSTDLRSPHIQQELLQGWCGCQNKTYISP